MNKIKTHIKNIINGMDMYMKEQRVIAIMLLCFVVSGASLPAIKSHMIENGGESPPNSDFYVDENNQPIDEIPIDNDEENEQNSDEPSPDDEQNPSDVQTPSDVQNPNQSGLTKPNSSSGSKPGNNNHQSSSSNNTGSNGSSTSPSSPSKPSTPSKPSDNPSSSGSSDKTWVPPVYKTVHHEAVCEKVKVYICNKCKEEFPSAGDFQVHKNLHGG